MAAKVSDSDSSNGLSRACGTVAVRTTCDALTTSSPFPFFPSSNGQLHIGDRDALRSR